MKIKFRTCATAVLASLLLIVGAAGSQTGGRPTTGYVPPRMTLAHLSKNPPKNVTKRAMSSGLPSKYDMRNTGRLTPVKDQGQYGTCWAFAAVTACESNYLTRVKKGNFSGSLGSASRGALNLSEMYVAWFAYKDDKEKSFTSGGGNVLNQGGNELQSIALLARTGIVTESAMPYGKFPSRSARPESYPRVLRIKDATFAALEHGSPEQNRIVKQLIMDRGAVIIAYYDDERYYDGRHNSYFRKGKIEPNHMITIVGWDDNYPARNFGRDSPSRNGAWLARNSFGTRWGAGGYFWISYEQYHRSGTAYTVEPVRKKVRHYGYDDLGWTDSIQMNRGANWAASVFQVKGNDEKLSEAGFYTTDNGAKYTVSVYGYGDKKPTAANLSSGKPVVEKSGTMDLAGYHTVKLSDGISLKKGEWFSVIVKLKNPSPEEPLAVERREKGYTDNCVVGAGESYFSGDGKSWKDGKSLKNPANACVKAFTLCDKGGISDDDDDDWQEEWDEEEFDDFNNDDYDDDYDEEWEEDWDDEDDDGGDDEDWEEEWDDEDYDIGIILIPKRK